MPFPPEFSCKMFSLSKLGVISRRLAMVESRAEGAEDFRFPRLGLFFGSELVIELLVAVMNELFAALRKGVGKARRIRCDVGIALVGGRACDVPKTFICEGGIQGAKR